ncbi:MAG: dephospho-CoA kinase [Alphaproteobacteria bacterium]|nr:dephospho-CoA kinase [Alphaproteobacteria bacterium]
MVVLGLTGSIGMGKSTAAELFRRLGVPVYDADAEIHRLLAPGGRAVPLVGKAFPGVVHAGQVDRDALGKRVFADSKALAKLEAILHPMARTAQQRFLAMARRRHAPVVVLDIPLLFETGGEANCDAVVVVTAPRFLQDLRVLRRPGMTPEKLAGIRARQMPDGEKRRRADFVVHTGDGRRRTLDSLAAVIKLVTPS